MEKPVKFLLPSPSFGKQTNVANKVKPHFLTPSGMTLLPREKQPPPMYGTRGPTVPAKYLVKTLAHAVETPELGKQYCEPCEMEFQSLDDFKRHRAQHEKCPVDGCHYRGHSSVMDKHINALHNTGLFDKFKKLNSPEEIAAWREERRKRFPTVAQVLLKQKAREQRQQRGERLEATKNRFGKKDDRNRAQPNAITATSNFNNEQLVTKSNKNRKKKNQKRKQQVKGEKPANDSKKPNTKQLPQEIDPELSWHGLPPFRGTCHMKDYEHVCDKAKPLKQNALFGLLGLYGSDDESEEMQTNLDECKSDVNSIEKSGVCINSQELQKNDDKPIKVVPNIMQNKTACDLEEDNDKENSLEVKMVSNAPNVLPESTIICTTNSNTHLTDTSSEISSKNVISCKSIPAVTAARDSSDEGPDETPIKRSITPYQFNQEESKSNITPLPTCVKGTNKNTSAPKNTHVNKKANQIHKRKSGLDYRNLKLQKQNTLLEKLLESDIRHERNVLLQCVRHVCENNFFGVGSTL